MFCACGLPVLHYSDPKIEEMVISLVEMLGPDIQVTTPAGSWWVPRHYIALHGLKAQELPHLGFPKVANNG